MAAIDRLIVALDVNSEERAVTLAEKLKNDVKFFKIGLELFSSTGPKIVERIKEMGCDVFLDLKFHDIPTTVAKAAAAVTKLEPFFFNVHASGGYDMMKRAADAVGQEASRLGIVKPRILAVTILTSLDEAALKEIGLSADPAKAVLRLAHLAKRAGLDGVVASPSETKAIRKELGGDFLIVTPGVRPAWAVSNDQKRVATPEAAIKDGADYIVVGRPVTESKDPAASAREILKEMKI
ncbi:MAG: orotidine-5'-phosphate decarboxylase [Candidatus Omnitrophica bacterium]|nr:orotidine-5'-phosphate decarboxylase [Candidatus Omnitrophota bacterium]MDD5436560.1 orotidine-5'-phosphate decarboxylase [Candidatus Omnitrophota bacterium]